MKVLYVCADRGIPLDGSKGASVHVRQTVAALRSAGVDVTVASVRPGEDPRAIAPPAARMRAGAATPTGNVETLDELAAVASAHDLALAALGESFDAVYERYSLWSVAGAALARARDVPLVVEVNAPLVEEQARYRRLALGEMAAAIELETLGAANAVLCVSTPLCRRAERLRGTADGVFLWPNTVDLHAFTATAARERTADPPVVVFVGSLKPWHGVDDLLVAFAGVVRNGTAARLAIVGDGPQREALEQRARELGVEMHVTFTGAVAHQRIPSLLAGADVAVAPYPPLDDFYFSPLKITEYLAAGLPVVATQLGDLERELVDGESVVRVPPGDANALTAALRMLVNDRTLRSRVGAAGRRIAEERLSLATASRRLVGLIDGLRTAGREAR